MSSRESKHCTTFPSSQNLVYENSLPGSYDKAALDWRSNPCGDIRRTGSKPEKSPKSDGSENHDRLPYKRLSDAKNMSSKRKVTQFYKESLPWDTYKRYVALGPSETTFLAVGPHPSTTIVAVKEQRISDTNSLRGIVPTAHSNIVKLKDAYYWNGTCFLVYDAMTISLERFCVCTKLEDIHIATICRETLSGLAYIYNELKISYQGSLYDNIFLTLSGLIQIGNVGQNMIADPEELQEEQGGQIGKLLLQLIQPGVTRGSPEETELRYPERWSQSLLEFKRAAEASSISELQKHPFLSIPLGPIDLVPLVWRAQTLTVWDWKDFSD